MTSGDKRRSRRPPELLTRDHVARCIVKQIKEGKGSPHGGVFLDIAWIKEKIGNKAPRSTSRRSCPACTTSSRSSRASTSPRSRWKSAPPPTTSWAASGRGWRDPDVNRARAVRGGRGARRAPRLPTVSAATRSPTCWSSASGPVSTPRWASGRRTGLRPPSTRRPGRGGCQGRRAGAARSATTAAPREPLHRSDHELQDMMQEPGRHRAHRGRDAGRDRKSTLSSLKLQRAADAGPSAAGNREYNPGWHTALDLHNLLTVSEAVARAAADRQGEPRRPLPRGLPEKERGLRQGQHARCDADRRRRDADTSRSP